MLRNIVQKQLQYTKFSAIIDLVICAIIDTRMAVKKYTFLKIVLLMMLQLVQDVRGCDMKRAVVEKEI